MRRRKRPRLLFNRWTPSICIKPHRIDIDRLEAQNLREDRRVWLEVEIAVIEIDEARIFIRHPVRVIDDPIAAFRFRAHEQEISACETDARHAWLWRHETDERGISRRVWRAGDIDILEKPCLPEGAVDHLLPAFVVPRGRAQGTLAFDENVVFRDDVMTAMGEDRPEGAASRIAATEEDVADDGFAAVAVVEINRRDTMPHGLADGMPQVVADDVAAQGRIAMLPRKAGLSPL